MSVRWDEIKRSMERSFKTNWKLFKQSKLGMVGLGIIIFFLIIAIFAPIIPYTYTTDYLAPAGDLYVIDNYTTSIPTTSTWHSPVSIQTPIMMGKPPKISGIMIYDSNGHAYIYPRNFTYSNLLRLENPVSKDIPSNMKNMVYLPRNKMVVGVTNDAVHMYPVAFNRNSRDINVGEFLEHDINVSYSHPVKFYSNVWDYNLTDTSTGSVEAMVAISTASGNNVSVTARVYQVVSMYGGFKETHVGVYTYNFTVNSTITANPMIRMDFQSGNETWVIVPTENYVTKYNVNFKVNSTYDFIEGISGVQTGWTYPMQHGANKYVLENNKSVALVYSTANSQPKKALDVMVALCTNNFAFGVFVDNGTEAWNNTITLNPMDSRIHELSITGMEGTVREFMMIFGSTNVGGVIAKLDPATGEVMSSPVGNKTAYMILRGTINYVSHYDVGAQTYYVSTEEGAIYEVKEMFYTIFPGQVYITWDETTHKPVKHVASGIQGIGLDKSFMVLEGSATPAVYLGNVLIAANQMGTYMGVVTKANNLYFQASSGTRIKTIVIPPFGTGRYSHNFYLFGSDYEGHDIWTWLVYGSRTSLLVGLTAAIISVLAGTFIGIISGFYGGWIDVVIMRTVDIILTLPGIVIMLLLAAVLGPSIWNIVLIIAVLGWAGIARVIRAVTLSLKNRPFMDAARVAGASNARMISVHIFPNVLPLTFLYMTFGVAGAILSEAALSFLGLGDPKAVSWGMMLQFLRMYGQLTNPNAWGWLLMPGIFIALISLAFYLTGRAFDEIVNPRLRKR